MLHKICAWLLGAGLVAPVQAATHYLRDFDYGHFERNQQDVIVHTSGSPRLAVRAVSDSVLRIWLEPGGDFEKKPSPSVVDEANAIPLQITDSSKDLRLSTARLELRITKRPLRLEFHDPATGQRIAGEKSSAGIGWRDDAGVFLHQDLAADEHIHGLGEDNDAFLGRVDRRGTRRDMWTGQEIRKGHVTADIPINFFMSTGTGGTGYAMFFDNSYRTLYDLGTSDSTTLSWQAEQGEILFYFFRGPEFPRMLDEYTQLTGRPPLPPLWSLGFIQSKCCYWDWAEIDEVNRQMMERQIPFDVLVIDYNWSKVPMDFQWADRWGSNLQEKFAAYKNQGRRFLLSTAGPMIRKDASNYQDALQQGLFATDAQGHTVSCGHYGGDLLDFTQESIKDWLWPQLQPLYDVGIAGWWLDLTEPEGEPPQTIYKEGPRAGVHNKFVLLNSKAYFEMQTQAYPRDRVFILTRTGFAGIQRYNTAIWTGDTWSDYATLMAHVPEALNTTMSGIPYWTNDSGGFLEGLYKNNLEDHGRLYERWLQFSVYSPLTRVHHVGPSAPYMFGAAVEESSRHWISERYRLMPYIYSYSWEAYNTGAPLMRALVFEYQNDPKVATIKDEYLFGRNLLVAPVLTENTDRRLVYFPKGRWIDQDYGHEYAGETEACVSAPRDRIPVFIKSGAIIPKAPLMQHTGEKPWDPLTLEIYPDTDGSFQLYQDDGQTTDYLTQKSYTETGVTTTVDATSVTLRIQESNKKFVPQRYHVRMHLTRRPEGVQVNGRLLQKFKTPQAFAREGTTWFWDENLKVLSFDLLNSSELLHKVVITLKGPAWQRPTSNLQVSDCPVVLPPTNEGGEQQIPHFWPPPMLPTLIQAENYDKGGEGVAWHDLTSGNQGGEYREDDVDIMTSSDEGGGYALTDVASGEWYEYTVNASKTGFYDLSVRYSGVQGGALSWEQNGRALATQEFLPTTAGSWVESPASRIYLNRGEQILRLHVERGGLALNWFRLTGAPNGQGPAPLCTDYKGGFGDLFSCLDGYSCKKVNEDWEHNQDSQFWCIVHEFEQPSIRRLP